MSDLTKREFLALEIFKNKDCDIGKAFSLADDFISISALAPSYGLDFSLSGDGSYKYCDNCGGYIPINSKRISGIKEYCCGDCMREQEPL